VVEFPPGSTVLIPSAILSHSNVDINEGEKRYSFTQYASGGLFRWVENGFKSGSRYVSKLKGSKAEKDKAKAKNHSRLLELISMFPTVADDFPSK
jgi:hypothetical protein